ncbi:cuticle protein, putative [Ixodes scapularis]|uniref:Cuticle protein, putative n=1 Tax=Ixodes scapularis TaxID=6945 RepID=B7Q5N2_IXOSC|nr:cuticle protein, putative [Ixodes scapularis]|eukprot:XP_002402097.1 cuticle protein, putative [Ixodes scapularis]
MYPLCTQPAQPYSFAYDNTDEFGTRLAREETGDANNNKVGSYSYTDAAGVFRTVKYVANADGFHATVETNEPGTKSSNPADAPVVSSAVEGPHPVALKTAEVVVKAVRPAAAVANVPRPAPVAVQAVHAAPYVVNAFQPAPLTVQTVHAAPVVQALQGAPAAYSAGQATVGYAVGHAPSGYAVVPAHVGYAVGQAPLAYTLGQVKKA